MLKNIEIKETFDKICNCHTCFVKLPIVTAALVAMVLLLSGCSAKGLSLIKFLSTNT